MDSKLKLWDSRELLNWVLSNTQCNLVKELLRLLQETKQQGILQQIQLIAQQELDLLDFSLQLEVVLKMGKGIFLRSPKIQLQKRVLKITAMELWASTLALFIWGPELVQCEAQLWFHLRRWLLWIRCLRYNPESIRLQVCRQIKITRPSTPLGSLRIKSNAFQTIIRQASSNWSYLRAQELRGML